MKTQTQKADETIKIPREKLLSLVSRTFGGINYNPNPDESHKPGPWDPVIRKVFTQMTRFGPHPDPWFSGSGLDRRRSPFNQYQGILDFLASQFPQIYDAIGGGQFPRPKGDTDKRLSALELLTAGAVFEQNAATVANGNLRHELRNAGAKLIETGIARM